MHVDGDAAAVVLDGDRVVEVDGHLDLGAVAGHGLVHRVVHELVDQVVQPLEAGGADVHAGAQADRLQALEHLDAFGGVAVRAVAVASRHLVFFVVGH